MLLLVFVNVVRIIVNLAPALEKVSLAKDFPQISLEAAAPKFNYFIANGGYLIGNRLGLGSRRACGS